MKFIALTRNAKRLGTVAIVVAVSLTALLGVLAIALDGGILLTERRVRRPQPMLQPWRRQATYTATTRRTRARTLTALPSKRR